jgi:hypothetical protein
MPLLSPFLSTALTNDKCKKPLPMYLLMGVSAIAALFLSDLAHLSENKERPRAAKAELN